MFRKILCCAVIASSAMQSSDIVLTINEPTINTPLLNHQRHPHRNFTTSFNLYQNSVTESLNRILPADLIKTTILGYVISDENQKKYNEIRQAKAEYSIASKHSIRESLIYFGYTAMQQAAIWLPIVTLADNDLSNQLACDVPEIMWKLLINSATATIFWNAVKFKNFMPFGEEEKEKIYKRVHTLKPLNYISRIYGSFTTTGFIVRLMGIMEQQRGAMISSIGLGLFSGFTEGYNGFHTMKHFIEQSEGLSEQIDKLEATPWDIT